MAYTTYPTAVGTTFVGTLAEEDMERIITEGLGYIVLDLKTYKLFLTHDLTLENPVIVFNPETLLLSDADNKFYIVNKDSRVSEYSNQEKLIKEMKESLNNPYNMGKCRKLTDKTVVQYAQVFTTYNTITIDNTNYSVIGRDYYYITGDNVEYKICKLIYNKEEVIEDGLSLSEAAKKFGKLLEKESDKTAQVICHLVI
jgi:hypothetical protein